MLKCKIDFVPYGYIPHSETIATIDIWNDGTGNSEYGNYGYCIHFRGETREGRVDKYFREHGAVNLLEAVIKSDRITMKNNSNIVPILLSVSDAATVMGVSRRTIRKLIDQKELPMIKVGNVMKIPSEDITAWVKNELSKAGWE